MKVQVYRQKRRLVWKRKEISDLNDPGNFSCN